MTNDVKKIDSSLEQRVYCIYDSLLRTYGDVFVADGKQFRDICYAFANDCSSKFYLSTSNFEIHCLGVFDSVSGSINETRYTVCNLSQYIDQRKRDIQTCIQTLNYLPVGYFKMPDDFKKDIQEKIDKSIEYYVKEFCVDNVKTAVDS